MIAYALRPFRYSDDGITVRQIAAGTVFNCRPDLFAGLERGGLVRPAGDKMDRAPIEAGAPVMLDTSAAPAQPGQDGDGEAEGGEGSGDASPATDGAPTRLDVPTELPEDRDALAVIAESMGLRVHHRAGPERIREQIEAARAAGVKG